MGLYDTYIRISRPDFDKTKRVLVTSDIHANLPYFKGLLEKVGFCDDDILIINGDFLEKGSMNLATLRYIMELSKKGNVYPIMGNCDDWGAVFHEDSEWARNIPNYMRWRGCGLLWEMAEQMGMDPAGIDDLEDFKAHLRVNFPAEFEFLAGIPMAIETEKFIFAHAAVLPKPLDEHLVGEVVRFDRFMDKGYSFDKWVVVGHYPVMLYLEDHVCANPIIDRQRHIVSIDGACVLKDDGQLNCLIIPNIMSDDFSYTHYDHFATATVLEHQDGGDRSYYIRWGDSDVEVLERGEEFSRCRHVRTGYEMDILTKYLFTDEKITGCNDCTDLVLPLEAGDVVSVVEATSRGYFVKHNGTSGWYFGKLAPLAPAGECAPRPIQKKWDNNWQKNFAKVAKERAEHIKRG